VTKDVAVPAPGTNAAIAAPISAIAPPILAYSTSVKLASGFAPVSSAHAYIAPIFLSSAFCSSTDLLLAVALVYNSSFKTFSKPTSIPPPS
jgi:hypothetical protein